jgi:hypothetical protein
MRKEAATLLSKEWQPYDNQLMCKEAATLLSKEAAT